MNEPRVGGRRGVRLSANQRRAIQNIRQETGSRRERIRRAAEEVGVRAGRGNTTFRGQTPAERRNRSEARTRRGVAAAGVRTRATTPRGLAEAVQRAARRQGAASR